MFININFALSKHQSDRNVGRRNICKNGHQSGSVPKGKVKRRSSVDELSGEKKKNKSSKDDIEIPESSYLDP